MVEPTTAGNRSRALRGALSLVLALLLAASVGFAVAAAAGFVGDDEGDSVQSRRDSVMLAARQYVEAASNYGPSDLDEQNLLTAYRERVRPLVSTTYTPQFETSIENLSPLVVQGFAVRTTVDRAAVAELGDDRAVVLVSGETARSVQNRTEDSQGFTLEVTLVLVDDRWLVDSAPADVAAAVEQPSGPAGEPSATPSDSPSGQDKPRKQGKNSGNDSGTKGSGQ